MLKGIITKAEIAEGLIEYVDIDTPKGSEDARENNIRGIPTLVNLKTKARKIGVLSKSQLLDFIGD